jgi:YHS domain-containing protein
MKTAMYLAMAGSLVLAAGLIAAGCREQPTPVAPPAPTKEQTQAPEGAAGAIAQKTCPVMGNPINPNIYMDYNDRRIYFCCTMCPDMFKKDPEKYLKKVDEELKAAAPADKPAAMPEKKAG